MDSKTLFSWFVASVCWTSFVVAARMFLKCKKLVSSNPPSSSSTSSSYHSIKFMLLLFLSLNRSVESLSYFLNLIEESQCTSSTPSSLCLGVRLINRPWSCLNHMSIWAAILLIFLLTLERFQLIEGVETDSNYPQQRRLRLTLLKKIMSYAVIFICLGYFLDTLYTIIGLLDEGYWRDTIFSKIISIFTQIRLLVELLAGLAGIVIDNLFNSRMVQTALTLYSRRVTRDRYADIDGGGMVGDATTHVMNQDDVTTLISSYPLSPNYIHNGDDNHSITSTKSIEPMPLSNIAGSGGSTISKSIQQKIRHQLFIFLVGILSLDLLSLLAIVLQSQVADLAQVSGEIQVLVHSLTVLHVWLLLRFLNLLKRGVADLDKMDAGAAVDSSFEKY